MKIAITADVHLTSYARNPERNHALENILNQLIDLQIDKLIIAGDLFDNTSNNPAELEALVGKGKFGQITIYIIPGNHDPAISKGAFSSQNIRYLTEPELISFSEDISFLFIPYTTQRSVGEALASNQERFEDTAWVLIAHGDYLSSTTLRNNYEKGLYMPLSMRDIQLYQPQKVFLGHIHSPFDSDILNYPGSPCGLDITETGKRSFLIYDSCNNQVNRQAINTDVVYFQEHLTILPLEDEAAYLRRDLERRLSLWGLSENDKKAVKLRVIVQGYSGNRDLVLKTITEFMVEQKIIIYEAPDLSKVRISDDMMQADLILAVQERLNTLSLPDGYDEPTIDDYILAAMSQVYGG